MCEVFEHTADRRPSGYRHAASGNAAGDCRDSSDKPLSHDTSRIACVKLMTPAGEEFALECPWVWLRQPAHCVTPKPQAWVDPEDPDTPRRTARTATRLARPGPADRLGRRETV